MKTVMLLGSYGQRNIGDDILLVNYVKLLEDWKYGRVYINTNDINSTTTLLKTTTLDTVFFDTYNTPWYKLFLYIVRSEAIFYGGGTIFKELYTTTGRSKFSVIFRIMLFNGVARAINKRVYNLNIGIGHISSNTGKYITKFAILFCTKTVFRDKNSYDYAKNTLGIPAAKIDMAPDGLFINNTWITPDGNEPRKDKQMTVGINLLSDIPDWVDRRSFIDTICLFINELCDTGVSVRLIPFQADYGKTNDYTFIKKEIIPKISDKAILLDEVNTNTILNTYRCLDLMIGMRFHSLLLACATNTPIICIAYDTKCWRFIKSENYPYGIKIEDIDVERLRMEYNMIQSRIEPTKKKLKNIAIKNFNDAAVWQKHFKKILNT